MPFQQTFLLTFFRIALKTTEIFKCWNCRGFTYIYMHTFTYRENPVCKFWFFKYFSYYV